MKSIIPTAGYGSRLRPFTHTVPKVLLQVADKPILGHIIDSLTDNGVDEIIVVVGYLGEMIEAYVKEAYPGLKSRFVEQPDPRGLGHAIFLAGEAIENPDEPVLIILGDTIIETDFSRVHDAKTSLIGVREVEDPRRFGVVELDGERIVGMEEKPDDPKTNYAIVGLYYLTSGKPLFDALRANVEAGKKTRGEIQLTDALQKILADGQEMAPWPISGWFDCGKPETLLETNDMLLSKRFGDVSRELEDRCTTVRVRPPVWIDPTAEVEHCILGPNVTIGKNAKVNDCVLRNTIINDGAEVRNVVLTDSIIGNHATVEEPARHYYVGDTSTVSSH